MKIKLERTNAEETGPHHHDQGNFIPTLVSILYVAEFQFGVNYIVTIINMYLHKI